MKILIAVLLLALIGLQYKLWFGDGSLSEVVQLSRELETQKAKLQELEERNRILEAQVLDLQNGLDAFEEKARNDLGMIKQEETFIQLIPSREQPLMRSDIPVWAIIPAAGSGRRMHSAVAKQYLAFQGKTIIEHCLDRLLSHPGIAGAVVVLRNRMNIGIGSGIPGRQTGVSPQGGGANAALGVQRT